MRPISPRERGVALLMVLWIFMVLGVLALDFSHYIRDEAMASVNFSDETRGYYVALAGMNRALFDAVQDRESNPGPGRTPASQTPPPNNSKKMKRHLGDDDSENRIPADGVWHPGEFAGARYEVRMSDEGALISLNVADSTLLSSILKSVITNLLQGGNSTKGLDQRAATDVEGIVDTIIDYEDCDHMKFGAHGNERGAKNAWFDAPEELLQIQGMTAELFYGSNGNPGLRDLVTVYGSRKGRINCQTVTAPVLQVLLKLDADAATDLVADRDEEGDAFCERVKGMAGAIDPNLGEMLQPGAPQTVRVEARADISEERNRSWVGAIVELEGANAEGPRVRRWLDRVWDGHLPPPPEMSGPVS